MKLTLKQINQFRPNVFTLDSGVANRGTAPIPLDRYYYFSLAPGVYECILNEKVDHITRVREEFAMNAVTFERDTYQTEYGTAVLMTVGIAYMRIAEGVCIGDCSGQSMGRYG